MTQFEYDVNKALSPWFGLMQAIAVIAGLLFAKIFAYVAKRSSKRWDLIPYIILCSFLASTVITWICNDLTVSEQLARDILTLFTIGFTFGIIFKNRR